jgi:hypothetical protein
MTSSGTCSAESASGVGSSEFRLELVEPLLSAGYALWTLAATPTRVGFTAGVLEIVYFYFPREFDSTLFFLIIFLPHFSF